MVRVPWSKGSVPQQQLLLGWGEWACPTKNVMSTTLISCKNIFCELFVLLLQHLFFIYILNFIIHFSIAFSNPKALLPASQLRKYFLFQANTSIFQCSLKDNFLLLNEAWYFTLGPGPWEQGVIFFLASCGRAMIQCLQSRSHTPLILP